MSFSLNPGDADTLGAAGYLVSDETDPAYLAWRAAHPDAFAAGTWERAASTGRAGSPAGSQTNSPVSSGGNSPVSSEEPSDQA